VDAPNFLLRRNFPKNLWSDRIVPTKLFCSYLVVGIIVWIGGLILLIIILIGIRIVIIRWIEK